MNDEKNCGCCSVESPLGSGTYTCRCGDNEMCKAGKCGCRFGFKPCMDGLKPKCIPKGARGFSGGLWGLIPSMHFWFRAVACVPVCAYLQVCLLLCAGITCCALITSSEPHTPFFTTAHLQTPAAPPARQPTAPASTTTAQAWAGSACATSTPPEVSCLLALHYCNAARPCTSTVQEYLPLNCADFVA